MLDGWVGSMRQMCDTGLGSFFSVDGVDCVAVWLRDS